MLPIGGRPGIGAEREVGCTASAACWLEVGGWEAEWCWEYDWGGCEIVTRWWVLWVRRSEPVVRWSGSAKGMSCGSDGSVS